MSNFSAKVVLITAILDTQTSWHIAIDVLDEYGIYYADDIKLNDILFNLDTGNAYTISEIATFNGVRWLGKVTSISHTSIPSGNLVIGRLVNGIFSYTNSVIQTMPTTITQEFTTEICELSFQPKLSSIRVFLNGIRLRLNDDDYTIINNSITIAGFEIDDVVVIDYERL